MIRWYDRSTGLCSYTDILCFDPRSAENLELAAKAFVPAENLWASMPGRRPTNTWGSLIY